MHLFKDSKFVTRKRGRDIIVIAAPATNVSYKNYAPLTKYITNIDWTTIGGTEHLDLVMRMYNLVEYSSNYSETTGSLWIYSNDEATNVNNDIENIDEFTSFKYKSKLLGNTVAQLTPDEANGILKNATVAVPLIYLRSLKSQLNNCKV